MGETSHGFTVLVVDDDEDHTLLLRVSFEALGWTVLEATSCAAALAVLERERHCDALVSDLSLDDGTALDLARTLGDRLPSVAFVLSGYDDPTVISKSHAAGFDAHIVKPASVESLDQALRNALARKRSGIRRAQFSSRIAAPMQAPKKKTCAE